MNRPPSALEERARIDAEIGGRAPVFFLDFDGTLAPIVDRPELAAVPESARSLLARLAKHALVCVLSGRDLDDVRAKVDVSPVYYGADHGRRLVGPAGSDIEHEVGGSARADLRSAAAELEQKLVDVAGALVEVKDLSLSVHYRLVAEEQRAAVERIVHRATENRPTLRLNHGKLVFELKPDDGWNKGRAMLWLLDRLQLALTDVCPICIGDDITDEDMFRALGPADVSVVVGPLDRPTYARYSLSDPAETMCFLETFIPLFSPGEPVG